MSERLAKIEGDTPRPAAAAPAPPSQPAPAAEPPPTQVSSAQVPPPQGSPAKPASRSPMALLLAACFVVTALVLSAYGGGIVTRWAPQLGSTRSSPEGPTLAAQSAPSIVQVASAETAPLPATLERPGTATDNATASNIPGSGPDRAAGCRATCRRAASSCSASRRSASRSSPVAAKDRARSRDAGAEHRSAQGEPAANGH